MLRAIKERSIEIKIEIEIMKHRVKVNRLNTCKSKEIICKVSSCPSRQLWRKLLEDMTVTWKMLRGKVIIVNSAWRAIEFQSQFNFQRLQATAVTVKLKPQNCFSTRIECFRTSHFNLNAEMKETFKFTKSNHIMRQEVT